jgi:5-enolpyruvylshikimate-3-phosphate synthase
MRKRCKRKIWQKVNPIEFAIAGAAITAEDKLDKLRMGELSAIESMVKGNATTADWRILVDMLNVAETMSTNGIGIEVLEVCQIVQKEMEAAAHRYEKTRKMGLSGTGIRYIKGLYALHDLQRTSISRSEFERMIDKTINYIRSNNHRVVHIT